MGYWRFVQGIVFRGVFEQRLPVPWKGVVSKHGALFNMTQVNPLGHCLKGFYLRRLSCFAGEAQTVAHILIVTVESVSRHKIMELTEQDLPPAFGIFLAGVRMAGGSICDQGNGFGFSQPPLGAAVEKFAFGVSGIAAARVVLQFSLDDR